MNPALHYAREHPWQFIATWMFIVLLLVSPLPIWHAWYFNAWEGLGEASTFWTMCIALVRATPDLGLAKTIHYFWPNFLLLWLILAFGAGTGRLVVYWARRS